MNLEQGSLTISLDFELYWGVRDKRSISEYKYNLLGTTEVISKILDLFEQYDVHVTWAVIGFLFFENKEELCKNFPQILPRYENQNFCPYSYIKSLDETDVYSEFNSFHFAKPLIELIQTYPNQEIASHSFSHYYVLEPTIDSEAFRDDIRQAVKIAKEMNINIDSFVFPRNQINRDCVIILKEEGIKVYRGNPEHWAYKDGETNKNTLLRIYRLIDTYVNLSGNHTSVPKNNDGIVQVKSSMFLRSFHKKLKFLEKRKLQRIKHAIKNAAINAENFHLWWHPHNFGINQEENLANLEEILKYYRKMKNDFGMISLNMTELSKYAK